MKTMLIKMVIRIGLVRENQIHINKQGKHTTSHLLR